jgi:hypothetical protein
MEACGGDTSLATLRLNATPIPSKALLHEAHLLALESFTSAKLAWRRFSRSYATVLQSNGYST